MERNKTIEKKGRKGIILGIVPERLEETDKNINRDT